MGFAGSAHPTNPIIQKMSSLTVNLPESIQRHIHEIADKEGISVDQFITIAIAEKISAIATEDYLQARAKRADVEAFKAILTKTPDRKPLPGDEL
jgi:parvulin-like peptidyl-prolyl isomerase